MSILIPVKDGADFIDRSLNSALTQSLQNIEVIVIDDASHDNTVSRVRARAEKDPRITLLTSDVNGGPGVARSKGLRAAVGTWIAILDADDQMHHNRLETLIAFGEKHSQDAVADNLALVDPGNDRIVGHAFPLDESAILEISTERFIANIRPGGHVNLGWMQPIIRRDFLLTHDIEWPSIRHAEDMVFTFRLLQAGAQFTLLGHRTYLYTQRRGTHTGAVSTISRTNRNASEQQRAISIILAENEQLDPRHHRQLLNMKSQVAATSYALDVRDAIASKSLVLFATAAFKLTMVPRSFVRCLWTRYIIGRKLL